MAVFVRRDASDMLEPDVTLTDLALALQCSIFATLLYRRQRGTRSAALRYIALFAVLALSSLFGAIWHGVFSNTSTSAGDGVWLVVMVTLAIAAALVWLISGDVVSSTKWSRLVPWMADMQLFCQIFVSAFVTDSFMVPATGLVFPIAAVIYGHAMQIRKAMAPRAIYGLAGFALAALSGLVLIFDISLDPRWATTLAVYHMLQFVAFTLVFLSVPATIMGR